MSLRQHEFRLKVLLRRLKATRFDVLRAVEDCFLPNCKMQVDSVRKSVKSLGDKDVEKFGHYMIRRIEEVNHVFNEAVKTATMIYHHAEWARGLKVHSMNISTTDIVRSLGYQCSLLCYHHAQAYVQGDIMPLIEQMMEDLVYDRVITVHSHVPQRPVSGLNGRSLKALADVKPNKRVVPSALEIKDEDEEAGDGDFELDQDDAAQSILSHRSNPIEPAGSHVSSRMGSGVMNIRIPTELNRRRRGQ